MEDNIKTCDSCLKQKTCIIFITSSNTLVSYIDDFEEIDKWERTNKISSIELSKMLSLFIAKICKHFIRD